MFECQVEELTLIQPPKYSRFEFEILWWKSSWLLTRGYFHIRRSGDLGPNFASEIRVRAPNFASKNIGDKYLKLPTLNFRYNPKCPWNCDSFPTFTSCGNRTSQNFPLVLWTWLNLAPNFACKLDVRSKPHDLLIWKYPSGVANRYAKKVMCCIQVCLIDFK